MIQGIRARYPEITLIAGTGAEPAGDAFEFAWDHLGGSQADVLDEHSHNQPIWFFSSAHRFDQYERGRSKVMLGEYCAHSLPGLFSTNNRNNLETALSEAAFLTGLERNADVVVMACDFTLFARADALQWTPSLIWFDNLRACVTPNYYVQQLFSRNRGNVVLPVELRTPEALCGPKGGAIGVGTWATRAEFKDLKIERDGQTLFASDFTGGTEGWDLLGRGSWKTEDGVLRQNGTNGGARAILKGRFWSDCTVSLKARKLKGAEGFLVAFNVRDPEARTWWNLGGWNNTRHTIEMNGIVSQIPGSIEAGRWYEVRIQLKGTQADCYLDGKLEQSVRLPVPCIEPLYASATRDNAADEVILKVVNPLSKPVAAEVRLAGVTRLDGPVTATVLTSEKGEDENTLDQPARVSPRTAVLQPGDNVLKHSFPAKSLTILRLKTEP